MPLKSLRMKSTNSKSVLLFFAVLFFNTAMNAQEIIKDTVVAEKKKTTTMSQRQKIDGVIATVGDYIILDSDIDKSYLEISSQGGSVKDITRCQMLGKLLEDKLYAHQAVQDSVKVTDAEVKSLMDERLNYMIQQIGSMEKVVKYYKKDSEEEFRSYFFDILKENKLTSEMQKKIVDEVEITPEEVRNFFKKLPKEDLPVFGAEMEVSQIVVEPKASGGFYKMTRKTPFVKEFKDVAFGLEEGEISAPFETEYGYHIIYLEKIKGQELELRHILLSPSVTKEALEEAKEKATLIRKRIMDKEISFADAARSLSDQKETRANGGVLINPNTQDTRFELTKMDPTLYSQVSNLKDNEISMPILDETPSGKKEYKIITVTNRINEHTADYAQDYVKIKELALKEKQIKAIGKWFDEKIKETYIKIIGEYRDCDFTNNWLKK